jgi:hypothetical protein
MYSEIQDEQAKKAWDIKMKFVHEHLLRREDTFYSESMECVKTRQEKKENDWQKENRRQLGVLRNILRREVECNRNYTIGHMEFKCDYELVEEYTGIKVMCEISKKFGCDIEIVYYGKVACEADVIIFDGTYTHEFEIVANIPLILSKLSKEIKIEREQALYDTQLFCRDIVSIISNYV